MFFGYAILSTKFISTEDGIAKKLLLLKLIYHYLQPIDYLDTVKPVHLFKVTTCP